MSKVASKTSAAARCAARAAGIAVAAVVIAVGLALLVPPLLGAERYVIAGGSMSGTYDRGSIVFAEVVPVGRLRVGDVITYRPPPGSGVRELVTHRIVWIGRDEHRERAFRTKGDANATPDPWRFTLHHPSQARVVFGVPWLGYVPAAFGITLVRLFLVGIPALLIGMIVLTDFWREAGEGRAREAAA